MNEWPKEVPTLTAPEAVRAVKRLWRFAMGETWRGKVQLTSGNRRTWEENGTLYVNPDQGWRWMVSDLAWLLFTRANPGVRRNPKDIDKLKGKLIAEVVKRGWLANNLKDRELSPVDQAILKHIEKENKERKQLEAGVKRWTTKLTRAQTMLTKYERKLKRYNRKGKA